ncbi:TPM domain-containing protein [Paenibacillus lemnae]|nr:TPM domain-containing protein [Paenibacillus lemnae]
MRKIVTLLLMVLVLALPAAVMAEPADPVQNKQLIFDEAGLLDFSEYERLSTLANELGAERETDIMILTTDNPENQDVRRYTQDFYDEQAPGYDKPHGNTVILTMDMRNREVDLIGFYKAMEYLDDSRLDQIRSTITPDLSEGNYADAFETYIREAHRYLDIDPNENRDSGNGTGYSSNPGTGNGNYSGGSNSNVNPDNILFNVWFQLGISAAIGAAVVGFMAYRSGGRVTVNGRTYEDQSTSSVVDRRDQYLRTTVTKTKIPKNNGGSGGGGGTTRGGHSHSGSRGSF